MKSPFAHRLKTARLMSGLSQEELAQGLGITKQAVSKYENGAMLPDSSILLHLAKVLGQKPDYFIRPFSVSLDTVEFRKKSVLKGGKLKAVKAQIIDEVERYLELEALLGLDTAFHNPIENLLISDFEDVEKAVVELLKAWDLGFNPLPNVIEMLEDIGIKIVEIEADDSFDGLSSRVQDNIPVIVLNKAFDNVRKRFTALHELGHLLLQIPAHASHKEKEAYCHRFAGAMLMPKAILLEELGKRRQHLSINELVNIKEYYGISLAAIIYRASDLGVISQSTAQRFWQIRNSNPKLKEEIGYGEYAGKEHSGRFEQLLYKALAEEIISISKAAYLANTSIEQLNSNLQFV